MTSSIQTRFVIAPRRLVNVWGTTEGTVYQTANVMQDDTSPAVIGRPIGQHKVLSHVNMFLNS